eukprot:scaffold214254_cov12-Tisochrysis_lutea.AAC.1
MSDSNGDLEVKNRAHAAANLALSPPQNWDIQALMPLKPFCILSEVSEVGSNLYNEHSETPVLGGGVVHQRVGLGALITVATGGALWE